MVLASDPYVWGTGRRKSAVARVRIKAGSGKFSVNGKEVEAFFTTPDTRRMAVQPLDVTESRNTFDVWVQVEGGGITGQAGAVSLGVARALRRDSESHEHVLREHGLLTRDSRQVERKKYGLRGARKATQYSKR